MLNVFKSRLWTAKTKYHGVCNGTELRAPANRHLNANLNVNLNGETPVERLITNNVMILLLEDTDNNCHQRS